LNLVNNTLLNSVNTMAEASKMLFTIDESGLWEFMIQLPKTGSQQEDKFAKLLSGPDRGLYLEQFFDDLTILQAQDARFEMIYIPESVGTVTIVEVAQAPAGILFGVPLETVLARDNTAVPVFVTQAIGFIEKHIGSEGLFRISGSATAVKQLQTWLDVGLSLEEAIRSVERDLSGAVTEHDMCSLLKSYLRSIPNRLVSQEIETLLCGVPNMPAEEGDANIIVRCAGEEFVYRRSQQNRYKSIINRKLPKRVRDMLDQICKLLHKVAQHQATNLMSSTNLVTVIAPNLTSASFPSLEWNAVIRTFVLDHDAIFHITASNRST